jgi:hypothetical protein
MKKTMLSLGTIMSLSLMGCGDSSNTPASVDFTGTWNYTYTTENTICDSEDPATGTVVVLASDSNASEIGNVVIIGNLYRGFGLGTCRLESFSKTIDVTSLNIPKNINTLTELTAFFNNELNTEYHIDLTLTENNVSEIITTYSNTKIEGSLVDTSDSNATYNVTLTKQ